MCREPPPVMPVTERETLANTTSSDSNERHLGLAREAVRQPPDRRPPAEPITCRPEARPSGRLVRRRTRQPSPHEDGHSELRSALVAGDAATWEELVTRYRAMLEAVARRVVWRDADVDEVVQRTFVAPGAQEGDFVNPGVVAVFQTSLAANRPTL